MLDLNCLVLGDCRDKLFTINVNDTKNVSTLKNAIKRELHPRLNHLEATALTLWNVSLPVNNNMEQLTVDPKHKLLPEVKISSIFRGALADDIVHILVKAPPEFIDVNYVFPTISHDVSRARIAYNEDVKALLEAILADMQHRGYLVSDMDYVVLKTSTDIDVTKQFVISSDEGQKLAVPQKLFEVFDQVPNHKLLHVIVKPKSSELGGGSDQIKSADMGEDEKPKAKDFFTELIANTHKNYENSVAKHLKPPGPATNAKSGGYLTFQGSNDPIYDGRYVATMPAECRSPPIQLYHQVFGHFLDDLNKDLKVPPEVVRATSDFMAMASGIYKTEERRRSAIRPKFLDIISMGMEKIVNGDSTSADGIVPGDAKLIGECAAIAIEEDKNEFGDGGSDPSTQAGLSYGRFWAQEAHAKIRRNSCCPTFLIAIAGASIAILGAIWTDKVIVQRLTDYIWLGHHPIFNDKAIYRNAHILHALGINLCRLRKFYEDLKDRSQDPIPDKLDARYFPSINAYRGPDGTIIKFTFIHPLEFDPVCTTFLARTEGPPSEHVVVKFVHRYNKEAHELLAAKGMAPKLRYCNKVGVHDGDPTYGDLCMIVMDFVDGETIEKAEDPLTFYEQIRDILAHLHMADYVFGDLREPNVMVTKNNQVMFIDFDMVGKHGGSKYPIMMSPSIKWPSGVAGGLGVMMKEHDLEMLEGILQRMKAKQNCC